MTNKQGDWELKIRKVQNGYILEHEDENEEDDYFSQEEVIEEKDTSPIFDESHGELEAMKEVLWKVKDYFGVSYSKHNKRNIVIEIVEEKQ